MYEIFEKLCKSRNITPYRFCKDTGVNSSTISTWKKKNSLAGPELAQKVCDYFGITYDYLMTGKKTVDTCEYDISNLKKHTENEQALLESFSKLNFKGEEEAIKRVKELVFVPEYTENQEELWELVPGSCETFEQSDDLDNETNNGPTTTYTAQTYTMNIADLIDEDTTDSIKKISSIDKSHLEVNAARPRTDLESGEITSEMKKHDEDIMDDPNF